MITASFFLNFITICHHGNHSSFNMGDLKIYFCLPNFQVTCRAIGIGSYVVRLGQRIVQVENSHIILTGAAALNKVEYYIEWQIFHSTKKHRKITEIEYKMENTENHGKQGLCNLKTKKYSRKSLFFRIFESTIHY